MTKSDLKNGMVVELRNGKRFLIVNDLGIGKDTEEIHHIIPICKGGLWYDENLMALCKKCHSEIHRKWKDEQYD